MSEVEENVEKAIFKQLSAGGIPETKTDSEPEESEEPNFDFSEDFQKKIAALCIGDSSFVRRTDGLIKPDYFDNEYQATLVAIALDYFEKYRAIPGTKSAWVELIRDNIANRRIRKDIKSAVVKELQGLFKEGMSDSDYVVDKVSDFAKKQAFNKALLGSFDLAEKGQMDKAQSLMEKAFAVGATDDIEDIDYWSDIERRTEYRKDKAAGIIKPNGISTGIRDIDQVLYHRGWGRRELSVLMGGAKKGKSMGLGEFAMRASLGGYNALYITLEVSAEIIMDRLDANVTSTDMDSLESNPNTVSSKVVSKRAASPGALKVAQFASGSLTNSGIRRIIEKYRAEGIKFDIIVVDYADIMAPEHRTSDAIENSKQIWLGLRGIAFQEDAAVLTATQTNRDGYKSSTAKAENVAEDFNKIRIADLVISINRDDAETAAGEARLFFAASRNQAGEFTIKIEQDLSKMKFIKKVVSFGA